MTKMMPHKCDQNVVLKWGYKKTSKLVHSGENESVKEFSSPVNLPDMLK